MSERIYEKQGDTLLKPKEELIRCKDCKHWNEWENGTGTCQRSENGCNWFGVDADDYCSYAERMESDEE